MKFGQQLRTSLIKDYQYHYIAYDDLKSELKTRLSAHSQWTEDDEKAFVRVLEAELDKVFTFQKVKSGEIVRRIKVSQKEVEDVIKLLDSRRTGEQAPTEEDFEMLEEDLSDIIADVHDLAKFTQLNYTGFQKIIKKHDKQTGWTLRPIFSARLNAKPFFRDNYDEFIVKLSRLYDLVRTRGHPTQGDSSAGGSQQNFVRQTTKYWVHPDNITELKLIILKHLPVLVFNANKEFEKDDAAISSIYYDNKDFELYLGRLRKDEGAEAVRLRWYGGMETEQIFVERKTHREDWTGEKSVKARFSLKEKNINAFLRGEYTVQQAFEKMRKEGKKSVQEIESLEALAREVQYTVLAHRLQPVVRSFYNRTAFQLPGDARVRISLDTELSLIREDNWDGKQRSGKGWRRTDIGIDFPFSQLPAADIERFPYAILEVKLQTQAGQEPPEWVKELTSSHLVEAVPKFSKFIHGCCTLHPDKIDLLPYWAPQMHIDIRKPITHRFGIERPNQSASVSTSDDPSDTEDEDDAPSATQTPANGAEPRLIDITESNGNGHTTTAVTHQGGNGVMDEEERLAVDNQETEDYPIYDSEASDDEDDTPLRRRRQPGLTKRVQRAGTLALHYLSYLIPRPRSTQVEIPTLLSGTVYARKFRAPPGKRIFVPVRVEPKVYFAAERTFLSWFEFAIIMSAVATTLLNFAADTTGALLYASLGFTITAVASLVYAAGLYLWRVRMMRARRAVGYHEKYGPTILCVLMVVAIAVNFVGAMKGKVGAPGKVGKLEL
ncbi:vacuolar transporter chaperone 4 [Tricharina praecox]|uniref:vacuolar transporter chaperone 4 n=1 Tax=Tricharina praecox TaxID=43433 RepID=UPI00221FB8B9|nr:vacuolar transporter chaperone 4 [Tricharina praecox]KAI5846683.1 vacuolar transporter chaperone 4 [Tricharina praecox]